MSIKDLVFLFLTPGDSYGDSPQAFNMHHVQVIRKRRTSPSGHNGSELLMTSGVVLWVQESVDTIFEKLEALSVELERVEK